MLHNTKLLMRRLAYVPWLLAAGLVLGWSGEAVADPRAETGEGDHSGVTDHTHATDPYLRISYGLADTADDSVFVSWSTSYSKNFHNDDDDEDGNGAEASLYMMDLFKGEIPTPANIPDANNALSFTGGSSGSPFSNTTVGVRRDTLILDLEDANNTGPGFYWVRIQVQVPDGDQSGQNWTQYSARQIAVEPDYILSVNPSSVREDAGVTDVTVRVRLSDEDDVDEDNATSVPLRLATNQTGLNDRFRIDFSALTIPAGKTEAAGTIKFIPIDSETTPDDDLLVAIRTAGGSSIVDGSTDIRLVDTDKASTAINLSFSHASLSKGDDSTNIVVTATLNGDRVKKDLRFSLGY